MIGDDFDDDGRADEQVTLNVADGDHARADRRVDGGVHPYGVSGDRAPRHKKLDARFPRPGARAREGRAGGDR